jgi:hypothetical protein
MAERKCTQIIPLTNSEDDGSPRMVLLFRGAKEIAAIDAEDADDAVKKLAVLVLSLDGGLQIGDVIQVSRI